MRRYKNYGSVYENRYYRNDDFLYIYILVDRIAQCIEYCAFAKAYATVKEAGKEISAKELKNTIEHAVKREL